MPLPGVIKTVETVTLQVPNGSKAMRFIFSIHRPIVEALMKRQPQQTHFMAHLTKVDFLKELLLCTVIQLFLMQYWELTKNLAIHCV